MRLLAFLSTLGVLLSVALAAAIAAPPMPGSSRPYALDARAFAREVAEAPTTAARLEVLARRWDAVKMAVAYCNASSGPDPFYRSSMLWYSNRSDKLAVDAAQDLEKPAEIKKDRGVVVRGDCLADITVRSNTFVHIYGDLIATVKTTGNAHCEIVVGGDIKPRGTIDHKGITRIFVGGNVDGRIDSHGSTYLWINGDLNGKVTTGSPSTQLHVMGDFRGSMQPLDEAALAYLEVRGFMPGEKIEQINEHSYTEFRASIGLSDQPPGLYPRPNSFSEGRWVIHAQAPQPSGTTKGAQGRKRALPASPPAPEPEAEVSPREEPAPQSTTAAAVKDAKAESMLRSVTERYLSAKTYQDVGSVHTKLILSDRTIEYEKPFSTAFERDGRFLWQFQMGSLPGEKPTKRYVVWSRGQGTAESWWDLTSEHEHHKSIAMALDGPTGISDGSAILINSLLLPLNHGKPTDLREPSVKGTEKIQGVECTIIEGHDRSGGLVRLWLDSTFAIRQVFESSEIESGSRSVPGKAATKKRNEQFLAESTITIKPTFDAPIEDEAFTFLPPKDEEDEEEEEEKGLMDENENEEENGDGAEEEDGGE